MTNTSGTDLLASLAVGSNWNNNDNDSNYSNQNSHHHNTNVKTNSRFNSHHKPATSKLLLIFYIELAIVFAICFNLKVASALYIKDDQSANQLPQMCHGAMPCGWEVYSQNSHTRVSNYFVYSPCKCPENSRCVRDQEDVRINSYIHRCKFGATDANDIEMVKRTYLKSFKSNNNGNGNGNKNNIVDNRKYNL